MIEARERRDVNRKEYAIAAKKNAAQYRLALGKKPFIAELIVRGVLEEHNGFELRAMQAKNKLYHPATIDADGQSVPGTVTPGRHDGITMLKELLEYLGGPGDSQDIDEHMLYLQTMRANPLPANVTEEQYAQRCERATEKRNIFLPVNKQLAGRELSKFFVEQMPMTMTQRG